MSENSWYAKLHPIGKSQKPIPSNQSRPLNLSLFFRIWIAVGIIVVVSGIVVFKQLFNYVQPVTKQVIEDTLVDTSKLLASSLQPALVSGDLYNVEYQQALDGAFLAPELPPKSRYLKQDRLDIIDRWYYQKTHSSFRVYVTDANGIVIYDSRPESPQSLSNENLKTDKWTDTQTNAEGQDYSQWNDVYLTLKGQYGARATNSSFDNSGPSIMYVAQPIYASAPIDLTDNQLSITQPNQPRQIIGVVSVGKPVATILPYLNATRQRMLTTSIVISIVALLMAGLIAWWLKQSMSLVTRYTQSLAHDTKKPYFFLGRELNDLTDTIENMKHRLENRNYVTDYVHTLTHELKSPLTAIRASGELLEASDLDEEDRLILSQTITEQSIRLQLLIDRLLLLAKIEQPSFKLDLKPINPDKLIQQLVSHSEIQRQQQQIVITYHNDLPPNTLIIADTFWLTQALQNLLDNALYFTHQHVVIRLSTENIDSPIDAKIFTPKSIKPQQWIRISLFNDGEPIPDYALSKVFERYFSLSHQYSKPDNAGSKKGTGLGLTLVKQVIERLEGHVYIHNTTITNTRNHKLNESLTSNSLTSNSPSNKCLTGVEVIIHLPILSKSHPISSPISKS